MTTIIDYWDRPMLEAFECPAGRTIRDVADYFGLVVPERPAPARFINAADRLHAAAKAVRHGTKAYYELVLEGFGEWSPQELTARCLLASSAWTEVGHAIHAYDESRDSYSRSMRAQV